MALVHKTVDVRPEVWRQLRLNAELSQVRLRDLLSYLILRSEPLRDEERAVINQIARDNEEERKRA